MFRLACAIFSRIVFFSLVRPKKTWNLHNFVVESRAMQSTSLLWDLVRDILLHLEKKLLLDSLQLLMLGVKSDTHIDSNEYVQRRMINLFWRSKCRNCIPGSLDSTKVAGKIVVCLNDERDVSRKIKKLVVEDAKAKGVIIIDGEVETSPFDSGTYPYAEVGEGVGSQILHYINSTK